MYRQFDLKCLNLIHVPADEHYRYLPLAIRRPLSPCNLRSMIAPPTGQMVRYSTSSGMATSTRGLNRGAESRGLGRTCGRAGAGGGEPPAQVARKEGRETSAAAAAAATAPGSREDQAQVSMLP